MSKSKSKHKRTKGFRETKTLCDGRISVVKEIAKNIALCLQKITCSPSALRNEKRTAYWNYQNNRVYYFEYGGKTKKK